MRSSNSPCVCAICGNPFVGYRARAKYCSYPCKRAASNAAYKRWKAKPGSAEKISEGRKEYEAKTQYGRNWRVQKTYGISLAQYELLLSDSVCEICGSVDELCLDHCHSTGDIRGVLCRMCNRALGQLGDTLESLRRAVSYLEQEPKQVPEVDESL